MTTRYDRNPTEAETSLKEASDEVTRLEEEIEVLIEESDRLEDQEWDTPEQAREQGLEVDAVQVKIADLQTDLGSASQYLSSQTSYWFEEDEEDD